MPDIVFNGGDEIRQPFRVLVDGEVADLTGCVVTVLISNPYAAKTELNVANGGVMIDDLTPAEGQPHGLFILDEEATKKLPTGAINRASARIVVVNGAGVTMSTDATYFARLA